MRLVENSKVIIRDALGIQVFQTSTNSVNMKLYNRCRIILLASTTDAAVVAGLVTLKQGSSATADTALAYSEYWKNEDMLAGNVLTRVEATSLASAAIRNKSSMYVWEVKSDMLDTDTAGSENTFIRLDMTAITTATSDCALIYELYEPRQALGAEDMPEAIA